VHYLKREDEAEQTARVVEQLGARVVLIEHFYRPALDLTPATGATQWTAKPPHCFCQRVRLRP
jgi:hypothetical protein